MRALAFPILVNLSGKALIVRATEIAPGGTSFDQIFAEPLKYIVNDQCLENKECRLKARIALPAYSMTLIGD